MVEESSVQNADAVAVAVASQDGNLVGGYERVVDETTGEAHYRNADTCRSLWYHSPSRKWLFSDVAGVDAAGKYASFVESAETDATSPDAATFPHVIESVRRVPVPGALSVSCAADDDDPALFRDDEFDASPRSLGGLHEFASGEGASDSAPPVWVRARRLGRDGQDCALFEGFEPIDVAQGALGNRWLLSAIAAIAEFPAFVQEKLFATKSLAPDGKCTVRLWDASKSAFVEVVVDDRVPCGEVHWWHEPVPLFAPPQGRELYVLLLEKALAKVAGNYEKLNGGHPVLAWLAMTGCEDQQIWTRDKRELKKWGKSSVAMNRVRAQPYNFQQLHTLKSGETKDNDSFFRFLRACCESSFIVSCSISDCVAESARSDGLVPHRAYSLAAVTQVGPGTRLVQLRNSWVDEHEWKGPWSKGSQEWTANPSVRASVGYEDRTDGLFWMTWKDFCRIFDAVQVCALSMAAFKRARGAAPRARFEEKAQTLVQPPCAVTVATRVPYAVTPRVPVAPSQVPRTKPVVAAAQLLLPSQPVARHTLSVVEPVATFKKNDVSGFVQDASLREWLVLCDCCDETAPFPAARAHKASSSSSSSPRKSLPSPSSPSKSSNSCSQERYTVTIASLSGHDLARATRRYSEFCELRSNLAPQRRLELNADFPPPQTWVKNADTTAQRRADALTAWLSEVCAKRDVLCDDAVDELHAFLNFTGAPDSNTSSFSHVSLDFVYENDDDEPNAPKAEPQLRLQCASLRAERDAACMARDAALQKLALVTRERDAALLAKTVELRSKQAANARVAGLEQEVKHLRARPSVSTLPRSPVLKPYQPPARTETRAQQIDRIMRESSTKR